MLLESSAAGAAVKATAAKADAASTKAVTLQMRTAEPERCVLKAIG